MALETTRRSLITGLIAFVAAPAIVRASNLMPVKIMRPVAEPVFYTEYLGEGPTYYRTDRMIWMLDDKLYVQDADGTINIWGGPNRSNDPLFHADGEIPC